MLEKKKGESRGYYEVPLEILESADDLIEWARAAQRTPPLSDTKRGVRTATVRTKR